MGYNILDKCIVRGGVFKTLLIFIFCTTFFSCENFMNGSELKQKFDEAVDYANAESFTVRFSDEGGKITPSGIQNLKAGGILNLTFREDNDRFFINWQILENGIALSDDEAAKIIQFDEINNPETQIKILEKREGLTISANCKFRPKIVNATPFYDASGVYRDRKIVILFDKIMDENSIYWTESELNDLNIEAKEKYKAGNKKDSLGNQFYYAYDDSYGKKIYKNIKITRLENESENLTEYYQMPEFMEGNNRFLEIKTANGNPPPSSINILVSVSGNFYTYNSEVDTNLNLGSEYLFSYRTSGSVDNAPPSFNPSIGESKFRLNYGNSNSDNIRDYTGTLLETEINDSSKIKINNLVGKSLWVKGDIEDGASGPKSLQWVVKKINNVYYPLTTATGTFESSGQISDFNVDGTKASVDEKIDLSKIKFIEGAYEFTLLAYDNNENISSEKFYFIYDNTAPDLLIEKNKIKTSRPSASYETVSWENIDKEDFDHYEIEQWDLKTNSKKKTFNYSNKSSLSNKFENLTDGTKYEYRFYSVDYAGNKSSSYTSFKDDTAPAPITNLYSGGRNKKIELCFDNPSTEDFSHVEYSLDNKNFFAVNNSDGKSEHKTAVFTDRTNGSSYTYYLRTVDFSGNVSDFVTVTEKTGVRNGGICYADKYNKILCSDKYQNVNGLTPVGIVCDVSDYKKIKIWDLEETVATSYCWSNYGNEPTWANTSMGEDGLKDTEDCISKYKTACVDYMRDGKYHTIFWWLVNKKRPNAPVNWYIPGLNEIAKTVSLNHVPVQNTIALLKKNNVNAVLQNGKLVTSSPDSDWNWYHATDAGQLERGTSAWTRYEKYNTIPGYIHCMAQVDME